MAQKIRIKDIAKLANVSPGTVDRVIHRRGNVSPTAKKAVEEALKKLNYKTNIHLSGISLKKQYHIAIVIPKFEKGEYWEEIHKGIEHAMREYDVVDVQSTYYFYDQFDSYSYQSVCREVMSTPHAAVIISPTFPSETIQFTQKLNARNIPFAYVDSMVEETDPLSCFSANQYKCGYLIARLITSITPPDAEIVLFQMAKSSETIGNSTMLRRNGFMAFFNENRLPHIIHREVLLPQQQEAHQGVDAFFEVHPQVKGAVVLSSRGHIIADYIKRHGAKELKLVCVDLTENNRKAMLTGDIDFVVGQRPHLQGFLAFKSVIQRLLYGHTGRVDSFLPLDIIARENIEVYDELIVSSLSL